MLLCKSCECPTMLKLHLNIDLSLSAMTSRRSPSLKPLPPIRLEESHLLSPNPSSPNRVTQLSSLSESTTSPLDFSNSFSRSGSSDKYSPRLDDTIINRLGLGYQNTDLHYSNSGGTAGGSMILYRLTDDSRTRYKKRSLLTGRRSFLPPQVKHQSSSEDSTLSFTHTLASTSTPSYPSALRGLEPYLYDPSLDLSQPVDDEDRLHDPSIEDNFRGGKETFSWRGFTNMAVLLGLISALLILFIFYPVWTFVRDRTKNINIGENININGTGLAFFPSTGCL